MSDQNSSEEIINSESITENESIQNQDQSSLNDQDLSETISDEILDVEDNEIIEVEGEEEIINQDKEEGEDESNSKDDSKDKTDSKIEDDSEEKNESSNKEVEESIEEDKESKEKENVTTENKDDFKDLKNETKEMNDDSKEIRDDSKEIKSDAKEIKDDSKEDKDNSKSENNEKMNIDEKDEKNEKSDKKEGSTDNKEENKEDEKNTENKKYEKDDSLPPNKKSYSGYRNDKGYGKFPPRGHQYSHHPYDDWGRRRGMNYPPYYEKDRRPMRGDFRSRDYRDFYDMRMSRNFRGFRDRDRDFDYPPKFYDRGRDPRFFNKRDRDFKYKRDYYDDYNRGMDKDMRMNNSMKECRVYVQNLSYDVTTEMLTRFMEKVGKVVSTEILTSPDGRSKGCAIVQYETPNEARRAISDLQDNQFQGRPIHIREDREGMQYSSQMQDKGGYYDKQGPYQGEGSSSNYPNNTPPKEQRIFVGNLDVNVTADDLKTLFEPAGVITYAEVFQKDRNQPSKHGIIGFQDSSSIKKAIEMFNGVSYRNRKLDVHEDRRGILPVQRRFNSYKSEKNMSIHNAGHHPYPSSKPYPPGRGGKSYPPGKYGRQPPSSHHQGSQPKMQQPPLPPHPSNSANQDKAGSNNYLKNQSQVSYNQQQAAGSVAYSNQPTAQQASQGVQMTYTQSNTQTPYIQPMTATTYSQTAQSTYAQPQGVQPAAGSVPLYPGYPMTDQSTAAAAGSNVAAYQSSYQTAAYYSSLSHQAQPVALASGQPVQQPYPVATNVDYNNLYSAYYGQASQVAASGYPTMMTQSTTTATVQGQATGYTEGSTLPTTYTYY